MIQIEGLDVRFGDFQAVQGVSFAVAPGEAFGLVGESGSGKTTVLKAIAGLIKDWQGRIAIDGETLGHRRSKRSAARCRWCSRTRTAPCTRATRSIARSPSRR